MTQSLHDLLVSEGYRLVEDAWQKHGRKTYIHDEEATRDFIKQLAALLRPLGWKVDTSRLRTFTHRQSGEFIEIEPGGADATGHFVHHMQVRMDNGPPNLT